MKCPKCRSDMSLQNPYVCLNPECGCNAPAPIYPSPGAPPAPGLTDAEIGAKVRACVPDGWELDGGFKFLYAATNERPPNIAVTYIIRPPPKSDRQLAEELRERAQFPYHEMPKETKAVMLAAADRLENRT
jgi:hypothetical protein